MENENVEKTQELEVFFTASAVSGLLSSNSELANHPDSLAKKAIRIGKSLAEHYSPVEEISTEE